MEVYRLRTFIAVAEEGHLTRAAKRLYTSQSAVSSHIKTLEEELGVTLFTRTPKGMELTSEGNKLRIQAKKALGAIDDLVFQAKSLQVTVGGTVRLGLNINPVLLKIGELLSLMTQNHPRIEFRMNQRMSWEVMEDLQQERLDGGFILGPNRSKSVHSIPLQELNLVIAGPATWENKIQSATWEQLAAMPWIWTSVSCPFHQVGEKKFQEMQLSPSTVAYSDNEYILMTLIGAEVGIGLLIEEEALEQQRAGKITIWPKDKLSIPLSFVQRASRENDPLMQVVVAGIKQIWNKT